MKDYHKELKEYSQELRRNMTKEERHLWYDFLKTLPVTVHRQRAIGNYIVDFYIAEANLVIELDGSQHFEFDAVEYDITRDGYLKSRGIRVLRYTNLDIKRNFRSVCEDIYIKIQEASQ